MEPTAQAYYLDSSTLIHAADGSAEYHQDCLNIITKAAKGQINAAISLETLEETLFILSKLTTSVTALSVARDFLKMSKIKKYENESDDFRKSVRNY